MTQANGQQTTAEKDGNRPVHSFRYGAVRAAVWKREVDLGNNSRPMYSVTFRRSYRDGNQWKDSASFGVDDLLALAKAATDAHTYIHSLRRSDSVVPRQ